MRVPKKSKRKKTDKSTVRSKIPSKVMFASITRVIVRTHELKGVCVGFSTVYNVYIVLNAVCNGHATYRHRRHVGKKLLFAKLRGVHASLAREKEACRFYSGQQKYLYAANSPPVILNNHKLKRSHIYKHVPQWVCVRGCIVIHLFFLFLFKVPFVRNELATYPLQLYHMS